MNFGFEKLWRDKKRPLVSLGNTPKIVYPSRQTISSSLFNTSPVIFRHQVSNDARDPPRKPKGFMLAYEGNPKDIDKYNGWYVQKKYDGYRSMIVQDGKTRIIARSGKDVTSKFPEIVKHANIASNTTVDGEIVVPSEAQNKSKPSTSGRTLVSDEKAERLSKTAPARFEAFDVTRYEGRSTEKLPIEQRLDILNKAVEQNKFVEVAKTTNDIKSAWEEAERNNEEGIVVKKPGSPYTGARSHDWEKLKTWKEEDFDVENYTSGEREVAALDLKGGLRTAFNVDEPTYQKYYKAIMRDPTRFRVKVRYITKSDTGLRFPVVADIYEK